MMICEQCGREFESKRATARYCSPACRVKASRVSVTDSPLSVTVTVTDEQVSVTKPLSVTQETVTVKVAGQAIELGKPYSTDKDNRWAPNYDLSEEGFRRRNKTWDERPKAKREATMEAVRRMHAAHVAKVASNTASRRAIVQACAV